MPPASASRTARPKNKARSKPKPGSQVAVTATAVETSTASAVPETKAKKTPKRRVVALATRKSPKARKPRRQSLPDAKNQTSNMEPPPYQLHAAPPLSYPITPPELNFYPSFVPPELYYPPSPPPSPPPQQWHRHVRAVSSVDVPRVGRRSRPRVADRPSLPTPAASNRPRHPESDARSIVSSRLESVMHSMDSEKFTGDECDLSMPEMLEVDPTLRGGWTALNRGVDHATRGAVTKASKSKKAKNFSDKVLLYSNSRLPPNIPSARIALRAWQLICLAAQNSLRVYEKPTGAEARTHVEADWRLGTKAMTLKSVPVDAEQVVVFAIRGSQTLMDWAVNLKTAPAAPDGFLDDTGNLCHAGFLAVARRMMRSAAAHLRALLEDNPERARCSLVFTGHSAGGAVASLLYAHMTSQSVRSELTSLVDCFQQVHCFTFGAPPVALLPLTKPTTARHRLSLLLAFVNEGDPVPRLDHDYFRSLLDLYVSPPPVTADVLAGSAAPRFKFFRLARPRAPPGLGPGAIVEWPLPTGALSVAGRIVVLRRGPKAPDSEADLRVLAVSDQQLRRVVYGDLMMHQMKLYASRVEELAIRTVTARSTR